MRKATIIVLGAVAAAVLAGCAAMPLPAPEGEGDCLMVIRTRIENPDQCPVVRNYSFQLASGGAEKMMPTSPESYLAFVIKGPDAFVSQHTNVVAEGWTGSAEESKIDIRLNYRAGYVVIAPFKFLSQIKKVGTTGSYTSSFGAVELGADEKAELLEELKAREGIEGWKFEE